MKPLIKLYTRRCRGCADPSPHTAHLTWLGTWRYIGRYDAKALLLRTWRRPGVMTTILIALVAATSSILERLAELWRDGAGMTDRGIVGLVMLAVFAGLLGWQCDRIEARMRRGDAA